MNWQIYKLTYKIESPLHIGFHKLGYVQRTRYYVPGRTMWGAGAEYLARFVGVTNDKVYSDARNFFKQNAILSYFYLFDNNRGIYLPKYTDEGIKIGEQSIEEFERNFISSFGKTAVEPQTTTAEEGSLHEIEFIKPKPDIFLIGYLFLKEDAHFNGKKVSWENGDISLKSVLSNLTIGGERRYGFGKISLDKSKPVKLENDKTTKFFDLEVEIQMTEDKIHFKFSDNQPLFAHLDVKGTESLNIKGDIEPLVGREWGIGEKRQVGYGQYITKATICWVPGSIVNNECEVKLGNYAILEKHRGRNG